MEQFTKYIADDTHYNEVIQRIPLIKHQLWIGTADIKDLYVARGKQAVPLLAVLAGLIRKGVEITSMPKSRGRLSGKTSTVIRNWPPAWNAPSAPESTLS